MLSPFHLLRRTFRRQPSIAVITILVLSLGTAAATTIYAIVDAVVLRPLPYADPERLVTIWDTNAAQSLSHDPISPVNFMDQRALPVFSDAAAWWRPAVNLVDPGLDPIRVNTIETSGNLFEVLGISPQLGTGFPAAGPLFVPNERIAVISDRLWRTRYNADASILGRQLLLNGTPHEIVGVMPPRFHFPDDVDVWQRLIWDMTRHSRSAHFMEAVARLTDDTSRDQAQAAVDTLWARIDREFANSANSPGQGWGSRLVPLLDEQLGYYRPALFVVFGAIGLLVTLGILNTASLMLARSLDRQREMAVRVAIGASDARLVAQLVGEGLVLGATGALTGLAAAAAAVPAIAAWTPVPIPRLEEATIGWSAASIAAAIAAGVALLFGVIPGWLLLHQPVGTASTMGGRGHTRTVRRLYGAMVIGEVALACALVVSSALLVRTVSRMTRTPTGVSASDTLIAPIQLTRRSASVGSPRDQWQAMADTHSRIVDAVRQQPGIIAVGAANFLPLEIGWRLPFTTSEHAAVTHDDLPQAQLHSVSDGYFEAMGARLRAGRGFASFDRADAAPVAIVNETFARRYLAEGSSVGRSLGIPAGNIGPLGFNLIGPDARARVEVVGVVADIRNVPLGQSIEPAMYVPVRQFPFSDLFIAVKAEQPAAAADALRAALRSVAPEVPVGSMRTWGDRFASQTAEARMLMLLLVMFGAVAALLAALGVYGLLSWSVATRTREVAIRLALGARPATVAAQVVRQSAVLAGAGVVLGVGIVRASEGILASVLYEVSSRDPGATTVAGVLLVAAALAACVAPALRAMRVDPMTGLRTE